MAPAPAPLLHPTLRDRAKTLRGKPVARRLGIVAPARESDAERTAQLTLTFERLRITASGAELLCIDLLIQSLTVTVTS